MPALTVNTSPSTQSSRGHTPHSPIPNSNSHSNSNTNNDSQSGSSSPVRPPISPITPVLQPLLPAATSTSNGLQNTTSQATVKQQPQQQAQQAPPRQTYTHTQPAQTAIPQPSPQPIDFANNPDVLALKASISILQVQARKAETDIQSLQRTKERALADPEGFVEALRTGKVKNKSDGLFIPSADDEDSEASSDSGAEEGKAGGKSTPMKQGEGTNAPSTTKPWPALPTAQNVIRQPPINWNKYAVVGESLDKLHADQVKRPSEGKPQRMAADGTFVFGGEGPRRQSDMGVAAPYTPGKDKIEKMGTRKGGKR